MKKNKKKILKIIFFAFILFSFHACSFFEDDVKDNSSESSQVQNQEQPGTVITPESTNPGDTKKTLILSFTPYFGDASRTGSRSAYPEFNKTQLAAYSYTIESEHFSETAGTYDSTNGTINFEINSLTFSEPAEVTVYAKSSGIIVWSASTSITYPTVANPNPVELSLYFQPYTSSTVKGEINLTVSTSEGFTVSCEVVNPSASNTVISTTGTVSESTPILLSYSNSNRTCTIETNPSTKIPAGSYTAKIQIKKGEELRDYIIQTINVWPGITTNRWYLADGDKHETYTISISEDEKKYYVKAATGSCYGIYNESLFEDVTSSNDNDGTIMHPFETVQYAINKCTETATKYTIICDGDFSTAFSIGLPGDYNSKNIKIIGAGNNSSAVSTFSGENASVYISSSKNITLENIKVTGVTGSGMSFYSDPAATPACVFTLTNCESSYNTNTSAGGGLYIYSGTVKLNNVTIQKNESKNGGGIYVNSGASVFIYGSTLIGDNGTGTAASDYSNKATGSGGSGGGIYSKGNLYIGYTGLNDSSQPIADNAFTGGVCHNYSAQAAGGIDLEGGTLYISSGKISYNKSVNGGAGIKISGSSSAVMSGGEIKANKAGSTNNGGGVYVGGGESFTMSGGEISGNTAGHGGGVYSNGGTFILSGSAYIPAGDDGKNDVELNSAQNAIIKIGGTLTSPEAAGGITATITPSAWNRGSEVLAGDGTNVSSITDEIAAKFAVSDSDWNITADSNVGKLDAGTTIYVSEAAINGVTGGVAGDDTTGRGTQKYPYATIQKAAKETWKAQDYTISVNGELKASTTEASTDIGKGNLQNIPDDTNIKATSITLTGTNNATINANKKGTAFTLNKNIPVTITSLKITGGKAVNGSGVNISKGIVKLGNGVVITGNYYTGSSNGGGVYVDTDGTLFMYGSSLIGDKTTSSTGIVVADSNASNFANGAQNGGGIYNNGKVYIGYEGYDTDGTTLKSKAMSAYYGVVRNYASSSGGGIYNKGTLKVASGEVSYNYGYQLGGGLTCLTDATLNGIKIYGNHTDGGGGGINIGSGKSVTIGGYSTISANEVTLDNANANGGGILNQGTLILADCTFDANKVKSGKGGAIHQVGSLSISGSVQIKKGEEKTNDVYIPSGKTLTITDSLSYSPAAYITPETWPTGDTTVTVLDGSAVASNYDRIKTSVNGYYIDSEGKVQTGYLTTVAGLDLTIKGITAGTASAKVVVNGGSTTMTSAHFSSAKSALEQLYSSSSGTKVTLDLSSVTFQDNKVPNSAFQYCYNLENIILPSGCETIGSMAFSGCSGLKEISIPNSVTTINGQAFENCTALESISIPSGVTVINNYLFDGCQSLANITINGTLTQIGQMAFRNVGALVSTISFNYNGGNATQFKGVTKESNWRGTGTQKMKDDTVIKCTSSTTCTAAQADPS